MITRHDYILDKIASDVLRTVVIDNIFIKYIQDMALDIFLSLNKADRENDTIRYIMTYCPYDKGENRYAEQYPGTDEQIEEATMYIDMAYYVAYWDMTNEGDVWKRYIGQR